MPNRNHFRRIPVENITNTTGHLVVTASRSGEFLVVGYSSSPGLDFYQRTEDSEGNPVYVKLAAPSHVPGSVRSISFNDYDNSVVVGAYTQTSSLLVYQFDPNLGRFERTFNGNVPGGYAHEVDIHPDGNMVAVAHYYSPFVSLYSYSGGTLFFIGAANRTSMIGWNVSFSPDGRFMATVQRRTYHVVINQVAHPRNGFSVNFFSVNPSETSVTYRSVINVNQTYLPDGMAYSPDGRFFYIFYGGNMFRHHVSETGALAVQETMPITLPNNTPVYSIAVSSRSLLVGHANSGADGSVSAFRLYPDDTFDPHPGVLEYPEEWVFGNNLRQVVAYDKK